jgi:hypothetical protein
MIEGIFSIAEAIRIQTACFTPPFRKTTKMVCISEISQR